MRSINATLLTLQKSLGGLPAFSLVVGTAPNTVDLTSFLLEYEYAESANPEGLVLVLDNKAGTFNTLSGDYAYIAKGAPIELKRGITSSGTDYTEELPTTWIEGMYYQYDQGQSLYVIECCDWLGKLELHRVASKQEWSSTTITTILEWILTQVGLTRESGAMTALTLDWEIAEREALDSSITRLMAKVPEYLHPGLDGEVKWREIDGAEASGYTFGWNAEHPMLSVQGGEGAWEYNSITVEGRGSYTGTATDATEIGHVGTRHLTFYDESLTSDAECAARAQAELDLYEAGAVQATVVCRPCHGLELWDVVKIDDPPWGGGDLTGRVIRFVERYSNEGTWHQTIQVGQQPESDPGTEKKGRRGGGGSGSGSSSSRRRRPRRRRRRWRRRIRHSFASILRRLRRIDRLLAYIMAALFGGGDDPAIVPLGGIIMWSGSTVPSGWHLCDGTGGTPNLSGKFIVASGGGYAISDTGGSNTVDLEHTHGPGTLNTADDTHDHGPGTLGLTEGGPHHHSPGTLTTDFRAHTHGPGTLATDIDTHDHQLLATPTQVASGTDYSRVTDSDAHSHSVTSGTTTSANHQHDVDSGVTANSTHDHTLDTGLTASDTHDHDVDSGVTAAAGSTTQENRPAFYALAFIMRTA